ncbi:DUF2171 domain-containing protein [Hyphomicrobium sp.]|uniref:DUF2171 domain-containing protein n=1 Tax=Hyphomicrobium sp. TaxID=82 RepID=UPI002FDCAD0E
MSTAKTGSNKGKARESAHEAGDMPESATALEKSSDQDEAVKSAVTADTGEKSVLPGPPIPPEVQDEIKEQKRVSAREKTKGVSKMIDPSQIREHMEVVGSDGEHVGTVDRCEGDNLKLTKNDPAAGGEHHYIPLAWVNKVDQRVRLSHPGGSARANWH